MTRRYRVRYSPLHALRESRWEAIVRTRSKQPMQRGERESRISWRASDRFRQLDTSCAAQFLQCMLCC
jgi:hypothetical protein